MRNFASCIVSDFHIYIIKLTRSVFGHNLSQSDNKHITTGYRHISRPIHQVSCFDDIWLLDHYYHGVFMIYSTIYYYTLLYITIHYYTLLYITIHYYTLLYIIIHYYTLLYIIIHYYTLLYIIIHYHTLLYIIIHYYTLLYIIIQYYILLYLIISYYVWLYLIMSDYILLYLIIIIYNWYCHSNIDQSGGWTNPPSLLLNFFTS